VLQQLRQDVEEKLLSSLAAMEVEMRKVYEIGGLPHFQAIQQEVRDHMQHTDHTRETTHNTDHIKHTAWTTHNIDQALDKPHTRHTTYSSVNTQYIPHTAQTTYST
ncbi:hypothetical protein QQ73_22055, partial [Candidatus Endoriftia persephone str. Guaymas]|nr:hypothetical protein [Candidatus Endoriftia persephone str. Guaymas]